MKKIICYLILVALLVQTTALAEPDFNFAAYGQFAMEKNEQFYIRQMDEEDIVKTSSEALLYANNSVVLIAADETDYETIEALAEDIGAQICGYIAQIDFYQLQLTGEFGYEDLLKVCEQLEEHPAVLEAHVDLYDPFPESGDTIDEESAMWNSVGDIAVLGEDGEAIPVDGEGEDQVVFSGAESNAAMQDGTPEMGVPAEDALVTFDQEDPFDCVNAPALRVYNDRMQPVRVGVLDYPVDYTHDDLTVANADDYGVDFIYEKRSSEYSHGTEVAGVIAAQQDNGIGIDGLCPTTQLYSYNAANQTTAYRTAALVRMIAVDGVRVLNFSIAYPTEISVAAHLGNDNAQRYVREDADYYAAVLGKLLDQGYDFLICQGAGNENGAIMVEDEAALFGYRVAMSEAEMQNGIHVDDMDAAWAFFTSVITDERIRDHILVVGACDTMGQLAAFSNVGSRVDLVAPGMMVETTYPLNSVVPAFGTSIAAPFASGTAACLYALNPELTAKEVKAALLDSASVFIADQYPLLNAGMAVECVLQSTGNG